MGPLCTFLLLSCREIDSKGVDSLEVEAFQAFHRIPED